ncbi:MAG: polysaccharide deacetylase family protein [Pseudoxanthomonas sp.]
MRGQRRGIARVGLLAWAVASACSAASPTFAWPEGKRAAVSLAYDDALDSQLDNAIPALDKVGLKGSFYLQLSREPVLARLPEWRAAAAEGHELGNHTLFHQCRAWLPDRSWVQPQRNLDTTTRAQMKDQVLLANTMLHAIDGRHARTMTVPCGDRQAQDGDYLPLVKDAFVAIKAADGAVVADMATLDLSAVPVTAPVGVTGRELIAQVEEAGRKGTMVNFTFHGIGGDYLTVSSEAHAELLAYLAAHRDAYWTDTFLNLMTYVRQQQAARAGAP